MTPAQWDRVKELFAAAVEREEADRNAFLRRACGGDAALLAELESLLAAYDSDRSLPEDASRASSDRDEPHLPSGIDRYRILHLIGEGGMGAVYLAVRADEEYEKRVAIKVVQARIDARDGLSRFRHERQILAALDHPNIAKLLDGGTTREGMPYFVMDFVEGTRIDSYCDVHRLPVADRVVLFLKVCDAVQYVHQNLVVHRDLKPGNILVTDEGVPKLLDFGIAKLLKPELFRNPLDATRVELRAMTPRYASPEQVRGEAVTTASDVYALGVILYELLTAHRTYDLKSESPADLVRAVCEEEPARPSAVIARRPGDRPDQIDHAQQTPEEIASLRRTVPARLERQLRGDLDAIVLKALRKEVPHRYNSVEQLAEDLRRFLDHRPVTAHADHWAYRTRKLIGRHRTGAAATALVLMSLVAGVITTSWQARIARAERARAEADFNDVRRLSTSFLFEFHSAIESLPGSTPARELLVQRALEYLRKLAAQARGDRQLQRELAEAYLKVGDVQGNPYRANLGDLRGAATSYSEALRISKALTQSDPNDRDAVRYVARSYKALGAVSPQLGNPTSAVDDLGQATRLLESLVRVAPSDPGLRLELAESYQLLGDIQGHSGLQNLGNPAAALQSYRRALAAYQMVEASGETRATTQGMALVHIRIGDMLEFRGDLVNALAAYRRGLEMSERLAAVDPNDVEARRRLALAHRKVGGIEEDFRHYPAALEEYDKAAAINEVLLKADPTNVRASMGYAISLRWSGDLLNAMGDTAGALARYRAILRILEPLALAEPTNVTARGRYSEMLIQTGRSLARRGDIAKARAMTSRGLRITRELSSRPDATPDDLSQYAQDFLTSEPPDLREPATALQYAEASVAKSGGSDSDDLDILAEALFENGKVGAAIDAEQRAIGLLATSTKDEPRRRRLETQLAKFKAVQAAK